MKSYEYVKLIATKENKDKPVEVPKSIDQVEDWADLIKGLQAMLKCSYEYIKTAKDCDFNEITPDMNELNCAGTNIQFATAQMLATYTAFYDLVNKMEQHNDRINEEKKS